MIEIDCLGDICPIPVIMLEHGLERCEKGESILLVTDHSCVPKSVEDLCRKRGLGFSSEEVACGVWELTITK